MTANLAIIQLLILLMIFNVCKRINAKLYSDQFVVQIAGGSDVAKQVAKDHGFTYLGEMHNNHYHLEHRSIQKRSIEKSSTHHELLTKDDRPMIQKSEKKLMDHSKIWKLTKVFLEGKKIKLEECCQNNLYFSKFVRCPYGRTPDK
ncbi:hypothetical protein TNCT_533001 [Trichonephila clavata]|uniref:Peptidase S8 pro-domain domain-containing protein n=1 Tax=Trichonephila clavata TaxID=2740835 RepID=A0A8X6JLP6_TRICU|nr:hypothetical protein TNCT_533001 [Trichonephila clavata]